MQIAEPLIGQVGASPCQAGCLFDAQYAEWAIIERVEDVSNGSIRGQAGYRIVRGVALVRLPTDHAHPRFDTVWGEVSVGDFARSMESVASGVLA